MSLEQEPFYVKKPFGVRLTNDEINFIRENYDDLFDGDENIQPRKAFIILAEKALATIKKNKQSLPEDLSKIQSLNETITELTRQIEELQARQREIASQFNDAVSHKINAEKRTEELEMTIARLQEQIQEKENEVPVEPVLSTTDRLLKLTPLESFILAQIEKIHNCDAKEILINRFFMVYQRRGNGDYEIKRISPGSFNQIENHFKATEQ